MTGETLTERQRRFIDHYIETGSATEAARRAGYSRKTAAAIGCENLTKPYIKKAIRARLEELADGRTAKAVEVLRFLTAAMRGEIMEEVPVTISQGKGKPPRVEIITKKISVHDQLEAAAQLMKRYGLDHCDLELEEKKMRLERMKRQAGETGGEAVTIIDDTAPERQDTPQRPLPVGVDHPQRPGG